MSRENENNLDKIIDFKKEKEFDKVMRLKQILLLKKNKQKLRIVFFNLLWLTILIYVVEHIFNNTDLINQQYKTNIFHIAMIVTLIVLCVNSMYLFFLREFEKNKLILENLKKINEEGDKLYVTNVLEKIYEWEYNYENKNFHVSDDILNYLGMDKNSEVTVRVFLDKIDNKDKERIRKELKEIELKKRVHLMFRLQDKWFFSDTKIIFNKDGQPEKTIGVLHDFIEICEKEDHVNNLSNFLDNSVSEIQIIDIEDLTLLKCNKQSKFNLGFLESELNYKKITDLLFDNNSEKSLKNFLEPIIKKEVKTVKLESFYKRKNNTIYPVEIYFFISKFNKKDVVTAIVLDIEDKETNDKILQHLSQRDSLTGIGNRSLLNEKLLELSKRYHDTNNSYYILYIDLDRFKLINDTFGHLVGDEFIKLFAQKIKNELLNEQSVYRMGGDEFIIVCQNNENKEDIENLAQRIINTFRDKTKYKENEIYMGASIGIALFPVDGETPEDLIINADIAVMESKSLGGEQYVFFNKKLTKLTKTKLKTEIELKEAINNDIGIMTYLQPQISIKGRSIRVVGAEVLVRWNHPEKGLINPIDFVGIAEETNLIVKLGDKILKDAAKERVRLLNLGYKDLIFAVNVSGKQLQGFEDVKRITSIVENTGCPKELIKLELTESMMMNPTNELLESFDRLKALGFKLALDDFGTGYSSLSYLKKLPLDYLKIDASFIKELQNGKNDLFILKSIINLANGLNLISIAEGVETREELKILKFLGCDIIQGYYFSKPLEPKDFEEYVKNFRAENF